MALLCFCLNSIETFGTSKFYSFLWRTVSFDFTYPDGGGGIDGGGVFDFSVVEVSVVVGPVCAFVVVDGVVPPDPPPKKVTKNTIFGGNYF